MEKKIYSCPMHPEVVSDKPGRCSKCGMKLELQSSENKQSGKIEEKNSYKPLIIIISLILISSVAISYPWFNLREIISAFMAGFFIIFAGFKMIDLKGFAQGYYTYDLLAKKWYQYGFIYPFIELFFGLAMILAIFESQVLIAEIAIMTFSGVGVLIKVLKHERFQCVCLGTFLKVPLTYVTLIEDFGMAALALILLLLM